MATGIEPITLPWKRPEKGVSAAELGASFRIEQREDGWHCTVQVGRRAEVLVTGMRRLRDAQCRAEAHAATMPEVARAVEQRAAEAAKPVKERPAAVQVDAPSSAEVVAPSVAKRRRKPTFQEVSDGCICGKIEGGTWIADPAGKVSVPAGTDPALAQEICRVAAAHYTAQRAKDVPAARTVSKAPARPTARAAATAASEVAASKAAGKATSKAVASKPAGKATSRAAASKTAAKATSKAAAKATSQTAAKSTSKAAAKSTSKARASKAAAKEPSKAAASKAAAKATAAPAEGKPAAGRGGRGKRRRGKAARKKAVGEPRRKGPRFVPQAFRGTNARPSANPEAPDAVQAEASPATKGKARKTTQKEAPVDKRSSKAGKSAACGCVTWTEAEGKARGEAKHGAFVIEPEGKKHALYFYDPDGQSRHVQSGDAAKLRSVAEEMAARGQPAPRAASAGDDAALLKMFMAGAMEDES